MNATPPIRSDGEVIQYRFSSQKTIPLEICMDLMRGPTGIYRKCNTGNKSRSRTFR